MYGPVSLVIELSLVVAGSGGAWPHLHRPHRRCPLSEGDIMATRTLPVTAPAPVEPSAGDGAVIRAEHLTKRFGDVLAVDDLSFALERGTVTGFLGPNGAGKTTTLRMLSTSSSRPPVALVFGGRYQDLERPASRVGAVLEAADFHPGRSGHDHLFSLALALGHSGDGNWFLGRERAARQRIDQVLGLVELTAAARASAATRSACDSGSGSPARCSATRSC